MKNKKQRSNFGFRMELRVRTALGDLADAHCLTPAAYLRVIILKEHANLVRKRRAMSRTRPEVVS